MFDSKQLFKERLKKHIKTLNRYLKYIFNSHIAFALFFFISAFSVFYQKWLETIPEHFPTPLIIGLIFAFLATHQPIRTFLEEADLVFLLSAERRMKDYFSRSLIYSYIMQLYVVLLFAAGLGPLYFTSYANQPIIYYLIIVGIVFLLKFSSLLMNWWKIRERDHRIRLFETIIRYSSGVIIFTSLVVQSMIWASIGTIVWVALFLAVFTRYTEMKITPWVRLVEKDQESMYSFYKLANLFTDVPHIKTKIKRRGLLTKLFIRDQYERSESFKYLFSLTFLRSGDYFNMFIRLTVLGGIFIFAIPYVWMQWIIAILFIYISNLQLSGLYHEHQAISLLRIYPIGQGLQLKAVQKILRLLSIIQIIVFSVILLIVQSVPSALVVIGIGLLFTFYFVYYYLPKAVNKTKMI